MTLEEAVIAKLQQLPENAREKLLFLIDAWIDNTARLTREKSNEPWRLSRAPGRP